MVEGRGGYCRGVVVSATATSTAAAVRHTRDCLEAELRSHPQSPMWTGVGVDLHLYVQGWNKRVDNNSSMANFTLMFNLSNYFNECKCA